MVKIGILGKCNEISSLIYKVCNKLNFPIIIFKLNDDFSNYKYYEFLFKDNINILVFNTMPKNLENFNLPKNCIILLNLDELNININLDKSCIITYGFKKNSTITISSTNNDGKILFCLQNNIKSILGNTIYQQEFPVKYCKENIYSVLVATSIGILMELEPESLKKVFLNSCSKNKNYKINI